MKNISITLLLSILLPCLLISIACKEKNQNSDSEKGADDMNFTLTSPAFKEGEYIPKKHTGEGIDVSPRLVWGNPPQGVKSFALICDDPDAPAGVWVHWVVYNQSTKKILKSIEWKPVDLTSVCNNH